MNSNTLAFALTLLAFTAACDSSDVGVEEDVGSDSAGLASPPQLTDPHPCPGMPGFTCSTLDAPLDYRHPARETLKLQVATADNADAPKGVLLFLTGGPGQPGVPFISRLKTRIPEVANDYRLVMIDQRGTGELGAIDCPALQREIGGGSDIWTPTPDAVAECASLLGDKAPFYSSDDTVADLERLRRALGVPKMVLDGVSYGTITAARYALAHPRNVRKVVLDSVAPYHITPDASLYLTGQRASARILRDACAAAPACDFDPAEDLAAVVRSRDAEAGVRLFHTVVTYEYVDPSYRNPNPPNFPPGQGDMVGALHEARQGNPAHLDRLVAILRPGGGSIADFSMGLHVATVCADYRFVWGNAATPIELRGPLLDFAERRLRDSDTWPFTPAVAVNQGFSKTCLQWPVERPGSNPMGPLPDIPILLLNGDHDMATPLEWARQVAANAARGELVIVKGEAHSIQNRERGRAGRDALIRFLAKP
ncbi:alpha/beta fold hydrolase [Pendulispora albinea]|uniref:Proline iminopeptidase n=1 Tax=Pendulispora albinea TaxID=2741071 RepID=A0ABZ2M2E7_9BACT